jgi:hypothetical protein
MTPFRFRPRRQRGATLVIALIMLMLMMIHALASFTAADVQLRNAGSLQARQEAQAAAQLAIAGVLGSSSAFAGTVVASPVDIDIDGDGAADYRVALTATCTGARAVTTIAVPPAAADDAACLAAATPSGEIPCADTTWNVRAIATRAPSAMQSGATVEINQGVAIRLDTSDAARSCPGLAPGVAIANPPPVLGKARTKTWWYVRPGV